MPKVYLDDSGEPIAAPAKVYLDDSGEVIGQQKAAPAPEEKSVGGFLGNVASSGAKFVGDTAKGLYGFAKLVGEYGPAGLAEKAANNPQQLVEASDKAKQIVKSAPQIASAIGEGAKNRYGSAEAIGNTLYNDPFGVAGDISTVAGGVGLLPKAGKIGQVARIAEAVSEATNPMRIIAAPAAKAIEYGTAAAVRPMLKPGKMLRRQQASPLEIERTALKEGAFTEGLADAKKSASMAQADEAAAAATTPVSRDRITPMPKALAKIEKGLDHEGDLNKLAKVEDEVVGSLPDEISASDLIDKRRYLDRELNSAFRAAERGGAPTGIRQTGQQEILGNIRGALREVAPGLREMDDKTRRLAMVKAALEDAGLRAGDIPMGAALAGAGTAALGLPGAGVAGGAFALGRTFPQIPLALGSIPVMGSAAAAKAAGTTEGRLAALIAALSER